MKRAILILGLVVAAILAAVAPGNAQRDLTKIPDSDPEIERKALQLAEGFEINLFAADPMLAKPIQMNWDAAGRLWVACSEVYPQIKPGQKANDKIIILEDTDGDGKADKTTVFADGLLIPTGVEPGDGGAYVADSTDLLHLADTDGDGKADRKRILLSGFGTEDTHHIIHTFRWGPDGVLYFNQSIYIHSHIETPYGVRRLNGGGIWQYRPESNRLEIFARGFINPWGHQFDRWGQSFVTDGANGEGINYLVPGGSYATAVGQTRLLQGMNPGSPKHCGEEILSGRHLPEEWRGNILTNDFRAHRVCRFVLSADGSGYVSREKAELIKTNHVAFRPIDIKMGPDGAIYIADWYNPIIQHGEVDFRDPRRDVTHGRIWRVTAKGRPLVPRPKLVKATNEELLEALKEPEDWTRHHARRTLKERGKKVLPDLEAWVKKQDAKGADYEQHMLEALWTYQSLDVVELQLLGRVLRARDPRVRAAAMRVVGYWQDRLLIAHELLAKGVNDDHPQVRLEAVRALAQLRTGRAITVAMQALDRPVDPLLDYALWLTARELEPYWLPAWQKGDLEFGSPSRMVFALQSAASPVVIRTLAELVRMGKMPADRDESALMVIASQGGPEELALIFRSIVTADPPPASRQVALLNVLVQATRQRQVKPAGDLGRIDDLLSSESETVRCAAARATGVWQVESLQPKLLDLATSEKTSEPLRKAAFEGLTSMNKPTTREALDQIAGSDRPIRIRMLAVTSLAALDAEKAAKRAAEVLPVVSAGADPTDLFAAFLQRKEGPAVLAKALAGKKLPADVAKIGLRTVRASGLNGPALIDTLTKAGGLTDQSRTRTKEQMEQLVADVLQQGDAARGELVYRRKDQACLKCHAIGGAGGQVGPDLASVGASAPLDYLIESLLLPNKAIKENYHSLIVATKDGKVFTGVKVRETNTDLILRDAEDREIAVPLKTIDAKENGASLMPDGLVDALTRPEFVDLVRFLSELGKVGPYAVGQARVVRRWQVLEPTTEARQLLLRAGFGVAASNDPALTWSSAYGKVSGSLPMDAIPRVEVRKQLSKETLSMGFVRCHLEATTGGEIKLRLNSTKDLTLWLDNTPVPLQPETTLNLTQGIHTLTFAVPMDQRKDDLRCELEDVAGSTARVRIISGK